MAGGLKVIRQTIDREDALIAYTRKNAYFVFQENDLGSIQPGKLADLVVLDRDYLTVPADQIKDIKPVMTVVGGKIVYDSRRVRGSRAQARQLAPWRQCAVSQLRSVGVSCGNSEVGVRRELTERSRMTWRAFCVVAAWCIVAGAWTNAQAPAAKNPFEGDHAAIRSGMGLFRARCADCHGMDARGVRGPDITQVWASGRTDEGLFTTIKNGIAGTEMPPQPRLFDHETWQILAYLRTLAASSGRNRRAVTPRTARRSTRPIARAVTASMAPAAASDPTCRGSARRDRARCSSCGSAAASKGSSPATSRSP